MSVSTLLSLIDVLTSYVRYQSTQARGDYLPNCIFCFVLFCFIPCFDVGYPSQNQKCFLKSLWCCFARAELCASLRHSCGSQKLPCPLYE